MTSQDIAKHFRKFGYKIFIIGILAALYYIYLIFSFILLVSFNFLIFYLYMIIYSSISQLFIYIIFLFILGNFEKISYDLNVSELLRFRNKFIAISIMRIIGNLIFIIFFFYMPSVGQIKPGNVYIWAYMIVASLGAVIILFIAAILEITAWNSLSKIFKSNVKSKSAKNGSTLCIISAIFNLIVIFRVIGEVFRVIGYILFIKLKNLTEENIVPESSSYYQPLQQHPIPATPTKRFCTNCGTPLEGHEKFCSSCGSKI